MKTMYNSNTEVRKLRPAELYTLSQILSVADSWKRLMEIVPKEATVDTPKFNSEHFSIIEQAVLQQQQNAAQIFLEEWSTMGKCRPTLRCILNLLVKAELFRAADYIAVNLLNEEPPPRPEHGIAAKIDISEEEIARLLQEQQITSEEYETGSTCYDFEETYEGDVMHIECASGSYVENLCPAKRVHSNSDDVSNLKKEIVTRKISQEQTTGDSNFMKFTSSVTRAQQDDQSYKREVASKQIEDCEEEAASERVRDYKDTLALKQDENYKNDVSNLKEDKKQSSEDGQVYREELMSQALPLCVADFGRGGSSIQPELTSSELPVFVNEIARQEEESKTTYSSSDDSGSNYSSLHSSSLPVFHAIIPSNSESENLQSYGDNHSNPSSNSNTCNDNSNDNGTSNRNIALPVIELTSSELPQVVVELALRNND